MAQLDVESRDVDVLNHFTNQATGKTFIITGPSQGGIGGQVAITLAGANPKQIILAGRSEAKILPVIEEIKKINSAIDAKFVKIDFLSNDSVRKAVDQIRTITNKADVLINNAGVMGVRNFVLSDDDVESQFAACYLGHFLLTNLLIKNGLIGAEGDTIVNVGSLGYQLGEVNIDDINFQDGKTYNGWKAYGQAKTAVTLFNGHLAKYLAKKGTFVVLVHPGVTLESQLLPNSLVDQAYFMEAYELAIERNEGNPLPPQTTVSLPQAAGVVIYATLNPSLRATPGVFIVENKVYNETREYATDSEIAEKLWKLSERLVGEEFSYQEGSLRA